jgi:hypothetical protein
MTTRSRETGRYPAKVCRTVCWLATITCLALTPVAMAAQTASTGALAGLITDESGAVLPGVTVVVTNQGSGEARTITSNADGSYAAPLLVPGSYTVQANLSGFRTVTRQGVQVAVAERTQMNLQLSLGTVQETVTVAGASPLVQTSSSSLGRVMNEKAVESLPLVTRNYTQILALSPGITTGVTNAAELGRGTGGTVVSRTSVHGSRVYDHNFQVDGVEVNDFETSTGGNTAGIAVPNPDTIQEFKVQTGQYDASFGRNAGANVNIITKSGTNAFRGSLFEFFRNDKLNANDFFFNRSGQPKAKLQQNQFGGTVGGPIKREKLLFFGSYQGSRQTTGLSAGQARAKCSSTVFSPPLTDDRSAAALGRMFAGLSGQFGGVAIQPDGSNINPVALQLLQMKLPDGSYLMPTPQRIDSSQPFSRQGFSAFSNPCTFEEDQVMANADYLQSTKSRFSGRFFTAASSQNTTYATAAVNVPGFPVAVQNRFYVASLTHSLTLGPNLVNEARVGVYRNRLAFQHGSAFNFSTVGIRAAEQFDDIPGISIGGSYNLGTCCPLDLPQTTFQVQDHLSFVKGKHMLRGGGGLTKIHDTVLQWRSPGTLTFQSFPDFLLGLDGVSNGSGLSNVFASGWLSGPAFDRQGRIADGFAYLQDDIKVSAKLTLNAGVRYERIGNYNDILGVNTNFDPSLANPNPPATGTLQGWVVPSNFAAGFGGGGAIPAGVTQLDNPWGIAGGGQNNFAPRLGVAWQPLPASERLVVRGGYGLYYTRTVGQIIYNALSSGPFRLAGNRSGVDNASATFANPFQQPIPALSAFPAWGPLAYSQTTALSASSLAMNYRPPVTQQFSANVQTSLAGDLLLEVGYVGTRGNHLVRRRSLNQAQLASPSNPIRGVTTNTVANILQRVPYQGWQASGLSVNESAGKGWYDGLEMSLTKRFSHGHQFLASYTFARARDTDAADFFNSQVSGAALGNQNDDNARTGLTELNRPHRFVFSYLFEIPRPGGDGVLGKVFGGWSVAGVTTIQTGQSLTITATNPNNVFGITRDRAQLAAGCSAGDLVTSGNVVDKLSNYFNASCFAPFTIIGNDGRATDFGNSGVGMVRGPHQQNFDAVLSKRMQMPGTRGSAIELRLEAFNVLNTPQFSNPDVSATSPTFGQIQSTAVSPRILQLAVKVSF